MRLTSTDLAPNARIPTRFTCDGADVSPPLAWSDPPAATRSFALVCADPDAPGGVWYHWAIYDIPPTTLALHEHWPPAGASPPQATNDFRHPGYGGPCPPSGHRPHHYEFRLYALDVDRLGLKPHPHCRDVEAAARSHAIATAELIATYGRN
ncbi:YbhB/YbcL family Raf kinase inhibitor-like protein [Limobrevibacterium gyesilva]|uniref:YbhB/YbcL family Raf kinase inhibitor-like protein n=1 Tax=Limobrevibacterium gyesilva TaxID=2991712 RepID=A0AA41YSC8_9PROT|nr:YbhB/YbcL family Raf kinase inhibitor-like protein [Limobrevibacterium gyesilva]MCW3474582.1 YbhB/YbcL family Raf kinase inhibitor-like protein [Limobrevibacterium gyesilva]